MQDRIARIDETSCTARPDHTYGSILPELGVDVLGPNVRSASGSGPFSAGCQIELLDCLIGTAKERERHGEAECLGGLEIDRQLDLCRLDHRQVCRLLPFT